MNLASIHRRNMLMCAEWYFSSPFFTSSFSQSLTVVSQLRSTHLLQQPLHTLPQLLHPAHTLPQPAHHRSPRRRNRVYRHWQTGLESACLGEILWEERGGNKCDDRRAD